jgi:hypothetical protein
MNSTLLFFHLHELTSFWTVFSVGNDAHLLYPNDNRAPSAQDDCARHLDTPDKYVEITVEGTRAQLTAFSAAISRAVVDERLGRYYRIAGFIEIIIQMEPDRGAQMRGQLISLDAHPQGEQERS